MATKYKKRPDGRYQAKVWDGSYTPDGGKHYIYLYSTKSSRDLENKVYKYEAERICGRATVKSNIFFHEYAASWLLVSKAMAEKRTQYMYRNIINGHLAKYPFQMSDFSFYRIQEIFNDHKHSPRICQQLKITIQQVGNAAELDHLIPIGRTKEVMSRIKLPKVKVKEKAPLQDADKQALFNAPFNPKQRAFVFTLYYTGVRREEALALTVNDVQNGIVNVTKAIGYDEAMPYIKSPKTERGVRRIPMPKQLQDILAEYTSEMPKDALLFPRQDNYTPMSKDSYRRFWECIQRTLKKADGKDYTWLTAHWFRHNYCTQLCYQAMEKHQISTKKIAELLGDTEKMVLEVYSHIIDERENVTDALADAFR